MDAFWRDFKTAFWNDRFWFPKNLTWKDLENKEDGIQHPQLNDLLLAFPMAMLLTLLRACLERYIFSPIGQRFGLKDEKFIRPPPNAVLENAFLMNTNPKDGVIQGLAKQSDYSIRQVERWFRMRRNHGKAGTLKKFKESAWRCLFYSFIFSYGIIMLLNKIWLWEPVNCWVGYPHHHVPRDIFWFYMIELGFYWSCLVSHFTDARRKDFWELFVHHIITLLLLCFSYVQNMIRIGTLVLVIHDTIDPFIESAKMAKYIGRQGLCDYLFVAFAVIWFLTRLVIFPWKIVYTTLFMAHPIVGFYPGWYVYNGLLATLQILHIMWFVMICRVALNAIRTGKTCDVRSDTEEEVWEDDAILNAATKKAG